MPKNVIALKQADIFYQFTPTQLELVTNLCLERDFHTSDIIFPEGAHSNELYIIVHGEVDIMVNPGQVSTEPGDTHQAVTIATLRRGQSFGEVALVDQGVRSATARAAQTPTRLLIIPRDKLIQLCDAHPELGYRLMHNLAADLALKMRSTDLRIRQELLYSQHQRPD